MWGKFSGVPSLACYNFSLLPDWENECVSCSAIQCTARCLESVVTRWCTDKDETKHGETIVQVKFASKHYKPTTKLAPQNNICQFLVALIHKKPWATCLFCYVHTFYFYEEYQGTVYRCCTDLLQLQSCTGCLFSLHLPLVVSSSNIWLCPLLSTWVALLTRGQRMELRDKQQGEWEGKT